MTSNPILRHEESSKTVHICAWCDDKGILTKEYRYQGYYTTHGACKFHFEQVIKETNEFYEKNGFNVLDINSNADPTASMQYDTRIPI